MSVSLTCFPWLVLHQCACFFRFFGNARRRLGGSRAGRRGGKKKRFAVRPLATPCSPASSSWAWGLPEFGGGPLLFAPLGRPRAERGRPAARGLVSRAPRAASSRGAGVGIRFISWPPVRLGAVAACPSSPVERRVALDLLLGLLAPGAGGATLLAHPPRRRTRRPGGGGRRVWQPRGRRPRHLRASRRRGYGRRR